VSRPQHLEIVVVAAFEFAAGIPQDDVYSFLEVPFQEIIRDLLHEGAAAMSFELLK
jgi:hypothetical protein